MLWQKHQPQKQQLCNVMWNDQHSINREMVAKSASTIAELASIALPENVNAEFLMVEESGIGKDYPFSGEKLSPVLTVYQANDFEHAE